MSVRGKKTRQTEEEVGRQRQGMDRPEFAKSQRATENREKWRKLVAKSSVVPQRHPRLKNRWRWPIASPKYWFQILTTDFQFPLLIFSHYYRFPFLTTDFQFSRLIFSHYYGFPILTTEFQFSLLIFSLYYRFPILATDFQLSLVIFSPYYRFPILTTDFQFSLLIFSH